MQPGHVRHAQVVKHRVEVADHDLTSLDSCSPEPVPNAESPILEQLLLSHCWRGDLLAIWSTNERLEAEPLSFYLDYLSLVATRHWFFLSIPRLLPIALEPFVLQADTTLFDHVELSGHRLETEDLGARAVCLKLKSSNQGEEVACEKWCHPEFLLIDLVDLPEFVLAAGSRPSLCLYLVGFD